MNDYESINVGWMRPSKKGDKLVISVDRIVLSNCTVKDGKVKLICNLNKVVGLLQGEVEVVAANHLKNVKVIPELKLEYLKEE